MKKSSVTGFPCNVRLEVSRKGAESAKQQKLFYQKKIRKGRPAACPYNQKSMRWSGDLRVLIDFNLKKM
jgi:hypothetical protein